MRTGTTTIVTPDSDGPLLIVALISNPLSVTYSLERSHGERDVSESKEYVIKPCFLQRDSVHLKEAATKFDLQSFQTNEMLKRAMSSIRDQGLLGLLMYLKKNI